MPTTLAYELDADHYAALLKHNQQRLMRQRSSMTRRVAYQATLILVCVAVGMLVSEAWLGSGEGKWPALALLVGIVLLAVQQALFQNRLLRRIAEGSCLVRGPRVLEVKDDGLRWASEVDLSGARVRLDRLALYTWADDRKETLFTIARERSL